MSVTYDEFCPRCHKFGVAGKALKPNCKSCKSVWSKIGDYWMDLDSWEDIHKKKKIPEPLARTQTDSKGYVEYGLEKDLNVLMAQIKKGVSEEIARKILDLMGSTGKTDPADTLNRIAIALGSFIGNYTRELSAAEKEAEAE